MTDPGLTSRLRQHSRRAGLNVGITMAVAIAICVAGFAGIYAWLTPLTSDFIPQEERSVDAPSDDAGDGEAAALRPSPTPTETEGVAPAPSPTVAPTSEPVPTPDSAAFTPTHQSSSATQINLRAEPSKEAALVTTLPLAAPLQFLNEEAPTSDPAEDGNRWMKFRTENGEEGWIREIDSELYEENP